MFRTIAVRAAAVIIFTGLAFAWPDSSAKASSTEYPAAYPTFPVTVNGMAIDQLHNPYPLLLYRNITYFPMTWDYTSALGLTVTWNEQTGLSLDKNEMCAPLKQTLSAQTNNRSDSLVAIPVPFPVKVNGSLIDNSQERYPVLLYNNITYFPMTWRFTSEAFNWQTTWDDVRGYSIQSCERQAREASLQRDALNAANGGQLAMKDEWVYMNPLRSGGGSHSLVKAKLDGSDRMELSADNALSINVVGDWLYYIVSEPSKPNEIYKIRTDGTGRTLVSDTDGEQLWVLDGYMYFLRYAGRQPSGTGDTAQVQGRVGIFRMSIDGSNEQQLLADPAVLGFYMYGGQVYFRTMEDGKNKLYAMR
ncbi:DUF5050 domain-containing protein [Paenibacillus allorhizosphaerae]|uniref:Prolow-density lipoprotein receptor-related protein 1-like beta-propeller domain-containing protein n=1 Tax=Paenibacillus allorhizosphaerae TaxID=2849866 RepID=A0ABN7TLR3_9BACL|nr:DUF5050 domain-containing protein [Paenibacillus allorhizosphaerae]CAG7637172.1 hypothetical protein PAECIP111802_02328 [Paenibacillus allorhizosphaerae]